MFFKLLKDALKIKQVRSKILFTIFIILVFRIGTTITVPGVNAKSLEALSGLSFLNMLSLVSGNAMKNFSIFALGVSPYITASIVVQLLQMDLLPKFVEWGKQGEVGRRKLNQATRYISLFLAFVQSIGITAGFNTLSSTKLVPTPNWQTYLFIGCILLSDTMKPDSTDAISMLHKVGITHVEMLSGDKQALVDKVADELQLEQALGDLLPQHKAERIETLQKQGRKVAFVGDGINDAPVLALSDVGVAMGGAGADMAIETADVVLQTDQPSRLAQALRLARKTRTIVWQNIVFAIGVKVVVMVLGLFGIATLWEAVFADSGVALLAVVNAMRIMRGK